MKVKRVGDLTYFIQFKNKLGNWGEPVFIDSLASDSTIRTAKELELQHTLGIRKLGKGDYDIAKFTIADNNGYYFGSSSNCNVMLYQDNKHLSTFSPEQMVSNKSTLLAPVPTSPLSTTRTRMEVSDSRVARTGQTTLSSATPTTS